MLRGPFYHEALRPMRVRLGLAALCIAAGLAACASGGFTEVRPTPPQPVDAGAGPVDAGPPPVDLGRARTEAKALLETQSDLYWRNWTQGVPIDIAATYQGHEQLFALPTIAAVQAAEQHQPDPMKKRALTDFELYLAGEHITEAVAPLSDQVANLEGSATVTFEGAEIPYRNLEPMLANEPDHARRLALYASAAPVIAKLNPLLQQKDAQSEKLVTELGYPSYAALAARMRDADLDALAQQAQAVLDQTDAVYKKAMADAVHRELVLDLADMRRADVPRFFKSAAVQSAFPAAEMMPRFKALLAGMGVDLDALESITIDASANPKKNPRAVCFAVRVPTDVRLSIKPRGGVDDYAQLYHEGGHALHFAETTTPVWEFQQLGNNTVTEAYAFLFEDRLEDPRYLRELGMTGELLHSYVRGAAVRKLYMLRRYAAKVLFEKAWHGPQPLTDSELRARYKELLGRAYGFPVTDEDASRYLEDHDDFFYSADYLRAWFLAAQLDDAFTRKYGQAHDGAWWHSHDAGKALQALWAHGNALTADEVAREVGARGLDFQPLLTRLTTQLQ